MNQYLKVAVISLMIMLLSGIALIARAADPELLIEFQGVENATEYQLFVELDPVTGTLSEIGTLSNVEPAVTEWTGKFFGLPMGKTLNYYLGFTDAEGDAGLNSPAYPFKLRGQGTIINIRRIK